MARMTLEKAASIALREASVSRKVARKHIKDPERQAFRRYLNRKATALSKLAWYAINGSK